MKNRAIYSLIVLACYSCSSTNLMSLSVMKPAPVSIPASIKTVAVVNRTKATSESQTLDDIHKALSLESNDLQQAGANASIRGLNDELVKNTRFTEVKPLNRDLR